MRLRSRLVAGAATGLVVAFLTPPALLGGAIAMQQHAPSTLRFVVHAAVGFTVDGLAAREFIEVKAAMRDLQGVMAIGVANAFETGASESETRRP